MVEKLETICLFPQGAGGMMASISPAQIIEKVNEIITQQNKIEEAVRFLAAHNYQNVILTVEVNNILK